MKSKFLDKRIELVSRELNYIINEWNMLSPFISEDDRRVYDCITNILKFALSTIEFNGDMITGDKEDESH